MQPVRTAALVLALALAGCGSKSGLALPGAALDAGSGGNGGSAGSQPNCAIWDQTAAFPFDALGSPGATKPRLVETDDADRGLALGVIQSDPTAPLRYWHAGFEPWDQPVGTNAPLDGTYLYFLESPDFALAQSAQNQAYALALGVTVPPQILFDPAVTPGASEPGTEVPFLEDEPAVYRPLFASRRRDDSGKIEHLLGYEQRQGERRRLLVRLVSEKWGGSLEHLISPACGSTPLVAAGASLGPTFFFATASSRPFGDCDDPLVGMTPPIQLTVVQYNGPIGLVLAKLYAMNAPGEIGGVALGADDTGLLIAYAARSAPERAKLFVLRLTLTGEVVAGPLELAELGFPPVFALSRLGAHYVLASRQLTASGQAIVEVRKLSETADVLTSFLVVPQAVNDLAILGSRDGKQLVLALTRSDRLRLPSDPAAATVLRYGCP